MTQFRRTSSLPDMGNENGRYACPSIVRSWLAFSTLATAAALSAHATANDSASVSQSPAVLDTSRQRTVVLLQSPPENVVSPGFVPNLCGQLKELGLLFTEAKIRQPATLTDWVQQAEAVAAATNPWLVTWVTSDSAQTSVYFYDPKGPHLYARQIATMGSATAASEAISIILRSAIQARIDGSEPEMAEIALPKRPPEPPRAVASVPPRAPPPVSTTQWLPRWGVGMSGNLEHPVSPGPWQAGIAMRAWTMVRFVRIGFGYSLFPDLTITSDQAALEIRRHPFEGFAGVRVGSPNAVLVLESGLGVDRIRRQTSSASIPLNELPAESRWLYTASERARLEIRLVSHVWLTAAAGVQIPLNPYTFDVALAGQEQSIARVLPVRPSLDVGLLFGWQ
jgi:hypothetical protein